MGTHITVAYVGGIAHAYGTRQGSTACGKSTWGATVSLKPRDVVTCEECKAWTSQRVYTAFPHQGSNGRAPIDGAYDVYAGNLDRRDESRYVGTGLGIQLSASFPSEALIIHKNDSQARAS